MVINVIEMINLIKRLYYLKLAYKNMKKIISITLSLIGLQIGFSQEISINEYQPLVKSTDFNLKGNVEKIISTSYDANGNTTTIPFLDNEYYNQISLNFNEKGKLIQRVNSLDYKGKIGTYSYVDYSYDSASRLTEQKTTVINNGEDPLRIASLKNFTYNTDGKISSLHETVKSKTSTSLYQTNFDYTNQLNEITTKIDNSVSSKNKLTYNKLGQLIKEETVSFDGRKGLTKYFIYDQNTPVYLEEVVDNRKQITYYDLDLQTSKFQKYDHNQNLKLELVFNNQKNVTSAKVQTFQNGKSMLKTYDIKYQFDTTGNWTTCEIYNNHNLVYVIKRTITYY